MATESIVDGSVAKGGSKRSKEAAQLAQRLGQAQQGVAVKEQELTELRSQLEELERHMAKLCRETGARSQRVNVATLKGTPDVKQVGIEMAQAIRRRQQRRKEVLRDKVNKLTAKLGAKMAVNRELRTEIDNRRRARLHHIAAVKMGGMQVEKSQAEVSELITASQRAYAEKETIVLKLADLKRRANEESRNLEEQMEACEAAMEELDDECRLRDITVEEAKGEVAKALELAKQAEEEHAKELERFTAVRNTRLELQNALDGVYSTLHVASFAELVDAYRATGSKVLSLWGKQGEQEDQVDALESEIKRLTKETESAESVLNKWRTLAIARQATSLASVSAEADLEKTIVERERVLTIMCSRLSDAFQSVPLLAAQMPTGATSKVTSHTLLQYLAIVEALVVRLVGKRVAAAAVAPAASLAGEDGDKADVDADAEAEAEATAAVEAAAAAASGGGTAGGEGGQAAASAPASDGEASAAGRRGRVSVQPPTIEAGPPLTNTSFGNSDKEPQNTGMEKLRYNRASLRSELMDQILSGVSGQMDRISEEERAANSIHKGGVNTEAAEALKAQKRAGGGSAPSINRAQRERSIDEWLARRRTPAPVHGPTIGPPPADSASGLGPNPSAASMRRGYSKGGAVVGGASSGAPRHGDGSRSAPSELRGNRSAPSFFASAGGREIFDEITRITADRASSRALAAETLPKLPGLPEKGALPSLGAPTYAFSHGGDMAGAGEDMAAELGGDGYGGGVAGDGYGDGYGEGLADPRSEIEEIERRLALLEHERLQIHQLKHMAVAAGNLASVGAPPQPPPVTISRGPGLSSSASMGSMPILGPLGGAVRAPLAASRSNASMTTLQPIGRQRVRS